MNEPKGKEEEEEVDDDYDIPATLDVAPTTYAQEVWGEQDAAAFSVPSQTRHYYKPQTVAPPEAQFKVPEPLKEQRPSKLRELMPLIIAFFIGALGYVLIRWVF